MGGCYGPNPEDSYWENKLIEHLEVACLCFDCGEEIQEWEESTELCDKCLEEKDELL